MYVGNSLYCLGQGLGASLSKKYSDIIEEFGGKVDTRTGDEIALDIINKAGLKVVSE